LATGVGSSRARHVTNPALDRAHPDDRTGAPVQDRRLRRRAKPSSRHLTSVPRLHRQVDGRCYRLHAALAQQVDRPLQSPRSGRVGDRRRFNEDAKPIFNQDSRLAGRLAARRAPGQPISGHAAPMLPEPRVWSCCDPPGHTGR